MRKSKRHTTEVDIGKLVASLELVGLQAYVRGLAEASEAERQYQEAEQRSE